MVDVSKVKDVFSKYINDQLAAMGNNSPAIKLMIPLAKRYVANNINGLDKFLKPLADENGSIDVEGIFDEEIEAIESIDNFDFTIPFIGDGNISKGIVSLDVPYVNKAIALNRTDFQTLKELLINEN